MGEDTPVLTELSHALVGFVIEVDNELERTMPHFTTKYGSVTPGFGSPWLISSACWCNVLRHIGPGMIPVADVVRRSGLPESQVTSAIAGLVRWGYVLHHADPNDSRPKPPRRDWVVVPTVNGKRWHEAIPELLARVEAAWGERCDVDALRAALAAEATTVAAQFLPFLDREHRTPVVEPEPIEPEPMGLVSLMARALLARTYAIEPSLPLGVAVSATIVSAVGRDGLAVRDVPRRSGVAKQEATTMMNVLARSGHAVVDDGKPKRISLTDAGVAALDAYEVAVATWDPPALRRALDGVAPSTADLHAAGGWRRRVPVPDTLPHFPVVTGHGGYPDGS